MNILFPIAGRGERFRNSGFELPKPLIDINGKTMIEHAVKSIGIEGNFIFITFKYENDKLNNELNNILNSIVNNPKIIQVNYVTEGPASSALLAENFINTDEELIILNCDQIMNWDGKKFIEFINEHKDADGIVVTYNSSTEKNSYIKLNNEGIGTELTEKKVISKYSLNGIHYWRRGSLFVESAKKMIEKNIRVNNEFYISLSYNELIHQNKKIINYHISSEQHIPVGVPEDLEIFLKK
jgi:NDP-sugar pyrophosphorylase family protein